jgi:Predicted membrane protein
MKSIPDKEFLDNMSKDPSNWKGPFYYNPRDPRLLVPKLHPSLGWTLNFANPASYVAIGALLAVTILISFFTGK